MSNDYGLTRNDREVDKGKRVERGDELEAIDDFNDADDGTAMTYSQRGEMFIAPGIF